MNCPHCEVELVPGDASGVAFSRCPNCRGTWFTEEGFREAQDQADPENDWLHLEIWREHDHFDVKASELACPSCGRSAVRMRYGETGVEIDHCPACAGIWLDEQELENIVAALEEESARLPARELLAAALREAADIGRGAGSLAEEWRHLEHILKLLKLRVLVDHPALRQLFLQVQKGTPFG